MNNFKKINEINGFDYKNLKNAKQNNYAWSMAELGDYIYVGTGRNIARMAVSSISSKFLAPLLIRANEVDNTGEIWRYKKDGSLPWTRVYKASTNDNISGFRYMITHKSKNSTKALYASSFSNGSSSVTILKSTDGTNWIKVNKKLEGASSRAMVSFNGILYISNISSGTPFGGNKPLLYASPDPEFFDFKLVINNKDRSFIKGKNPNGGINDMEVFNNRLYVTVSSESGMEVWRTNSDEVKMNDWTCVVDKGFGDEMNKNSISIGVFKNYLYVAATKDIPLTLIIPMGSEMIRIDKNDKWELVVGGKAIKPTKSINGSREKSLSGFKAGFSNPFNAYIWQIKEYKGELYASTFDNGSNIEVLRDIALLNKSILVSKYGSEVYNLLVSIYNQILYLFEQYNYPRGFDLFSSSDGIEFKPISLTGFGNGNNYGGRILMVSKEDELYVGTANPYEGCEVYKKVNSNSSFDNVDMNSYKIINSELEKKSQEFKKILMKIIKK